MDVFDSAMVTQKNVTPPVAVSAIAERGLIGPEVRVLRRFRLVFNAVKTHFQQVEKKAGVGGAQLWALSVIHAHPGIGVNSLAAFMDVHQTTASNLVKALVAAGRPPGLSSPASGATCAVNRSRGGFAAGCAFAVAVIGIVTGSTTAGVGHAPARAMLDGHAELPGYPLGPSRHDH